MAKTKVRKQVVAKLLKNWSGLTDNLTTASAAEISQALTREQATQGRKTFIERLAARLGVLNTQALKKSLTNK